MKKDISIIVFVLVLVGLIIPLISAGFFDFLKKSPTGKATDSPLDINISVTSDAPVIYHVRYPSSLSLTLGPNPTYFHINFSVSDADGGNNLQNTSAAINISLAGEATRYNSSCAVVNMGGNYANYSCFLTAWWFDADGAWEIGVNISDLNNNVGINTTMTLTVNTLDGFEMSPSSLVFSTLTPGTYNQTPSNHIFMNNTGNQAFSSGEVDVNATDLRGETTSGQALWAGNFSASPYTGGKIECNITESATQLVNMTYTGISEVVLNDGNYTINDGTGQERMYFCLREVGAELSEQYYSTDNLGAWTIRVGT